MYQTKFTLFILLGLSLFCSCSSPEKEQKQAAQVESEAPASTPIDKSKLLGVWWDSNDPIAPTATFMIEDSTIHYPDTDEGEPSDFRYWLKDDSLVIEYTGFSVASKISKATGDTLELISEGDTSVLVKTEPKL